MKQNLGIIGCGSVVQNMYVYSIPAWQNIAAVYTFDVDILQSQKVAAILNGTICSLEEIIQKAEIIIIASPPHTHYKLLKTCLQKGKIIICEKPFLLNLQEAKEIIKLSEKFEAQLFVAHLRRVLPAISLAKQITQSGILGEIKTLELFEGARFSYQTQSHYETNNIFGGVLADTGSHTIDSALYIAGLENTETKVENVEIQRDMQEPSHEIKAGFSLVSANKNISFKIMLSRKQALSNKINIIAQNGILEVPTGLENCVRISKPGKKAFVAYAPNTIHNYHQALALEYEIMFDNTKNHIFHAKNFLNLTGILEKLLAQ